MSFFERFFQTSVSPALQASASKNVSKLLAALSTQERSQLENILVKEPTSAAQLIRCLVGSEYLLESCCRKPSLLLHWLLTEAIHSPLSISRMRELMASAVCNSQSIDSLDINLRHFRRQLMLAIIWRDLNRLASFEETASAMTALAELCLQEAASFHFDRLAEEAGNPIGNETTTIQPFLIIGMGKLGGGELNVSSDIDLIFAFPEVGCTDHGTRPIDNTLFFTRLGQRLIKTLHTVTAEGFVFRIDMRLRPYGDSGALVHNVAALEEYYQTQGREWERFAMIKARLVSAILPSSITSCELNASAIIKSAEMQLETILRSFTYRKYVDFSVIEALRRLKMLINQEIRRKEMQDDIKIGPGGIREVEFIVQAFQLIRGGRDRQLQGRQLLQMLQQLKSAGCLEPQIIEGLAEAYIFLRNVEHALQAYRDEQTQCLPQDELGRERLAWVMAYNGWGAFRKKLQHHCQTVDTHFQWMVADPLKQETIFPGQSEWNALWQETFSDAELDVDQFLQQQGFTQPQDVLSLLRKLRSKPNVLRMSATARERLDLLMPLLLSTVVNTESAVSPNQTLVLIVGWLEKVIGRTAYIVLLLENPSVLAHLTQLYAASSWIAEQLTQLPSLLDELLDTRNLYSLPDRKCLREDLRQQLMRIHFDDLEALMETLRYFRISHSLRAAASEVTGHLPLMKASDYLTFLAEVILEQVLLSAWQALISRHGSPSGDKAPHFIIVGYGKLGGLELSYDSDLDLVFIYQAEPQEMTDGEKPIDNQTFYTRMGQKIIHILNTRTLSGQLYDVDMRLRPSGNSGLLVTSMQAFANYQSQNAWVWEHQALVRARVIAGYQPLAEEFNQVRQKILCQQRNLADLQASIIDMREKMRTHLGINHTPNQHELFNLKHDAGGIVDIEFMVQYAVLAWSHQQPLLTEYTDNIRILESLSEFGMLSAEQCETLTEVYKVLRAIAHRLALQKKTAIVDAESCARERAQVKKIWLNLFGKIYT
jgi:[glutamine synthetase] adenylyltransferase / [glutamine synthetase]-adenylyl-L-tyrosine phosphorylase